MKPEDGEEATQINFKRFSLKEFLKKPIQASKLTEDRKALEIIRDLAVIYLAAMALLILVRFFL